MTGAGTETSATAAIDDESGPLLFDRYRPVDLAHLVWLALMSVVIMPGLAFSFWTPRAIVLFLVVPVGLVQLSRLVVRHDRAAVALAGFCAWALLAGLLSVAPLNSIKGFAGRETSVVMLVAFASAWAFGRSASERVRRDAPLVLIGTLGAHLLVGMVQIVFDVTSGLIGSTPGRAAGLAINPVYFGALMAAGLAYSWVRYLDDADEPWLGVVALASFGVSLSGSRVAIAAGVVVVVFASFRRPVRRVAADAGAFLLGTLGATMFTAMIGARSAVDRAGAADSGGRFDVWIAGWHAFTDHPIVGSGPGLFRTAAQRHFTDDFATRFDLRGDQMWADPHNVVVNLAVGTGLVGVALLCAFVVLGARAGRPQLLAIAGAVALTWLLQPLFIATAVIALYFFGLAVPPRVTEPASDRRPSGRAVETAAVVLGVILAAGLFAVDRNVDASWDSSDPAELADAVRWYWKDPRLTAQVAERYSVLALQDSTYIPEALDYSSRTAEYQSEIPRWWTELAGRQLLFGDVTGAAVSLERALELQENYPDAWLLSNEVARRLGDPDLANRAAERSCDLAPDICEVFVQP